MLSKEKKVIISGFDPFDKVKVNPSMEVVKSLKEDDFKGAKLYPVILPTVYEKSRELLLNKITEINPDLVISLGVAFGRKKITLERFALNIDDARTKDNAGVVRRGHFISPGGREAFISRLPLENILEELHRYKIKADISNFCGTFVCNHLMYSIIEYINEKKLSLVYGFVHLPGLERMKKGKKTGLSFEIMNKGVRIIINKCLTSL